MKVPIIILIVTILTGFAAFFATKKDWHQDKKRMIAPFFILILTIVAAIVAFFENAADREQQEIDTKQKNRIEALVKEADILSESSRRLQLHNIALSKESKSIVEANENITKKNLLLTSSTKTLVGQVKNLTSDVNVLLGKVHDEITGGNSVPIVKANLQRFIYDERDEKTYQLRNADWKFVVDYSIFNQGKYPLNRVRVFQQTPMDRIRTIWKDLTSIDYLQRGESRTIIPLSIISLMPHETRTLMLNVTWKTGYTYVINLTGEEIIDPTNGNPIDTVVNKKETYLYKGNSLNSPEELIKAIEKDLGKGND